MSLEITFSRPGKPPVRVTAVDGRSGLIRGLRLLLANNDLQPGDLLAVTAEDLPQVSRASHHS